MAKYKLLEVSEEGDQLIEKSDYSHKFSASGVIENINYLKKVQKELTAQISLNGAELENYAHFHPFVEKLSDEELGVAFLYKRSKATKEESEKKLVECEEMLTEEVEAIKDIKEQTEYEIVLPELFSIRIEDKE
jgi:hypothetical protein